MCDPSSCSIIVIQGKRVVPYPNNNLDVRIHYLLPKNYAVILHRTDSPYPNLTLTLPLTIVFRPTLYPKPSLEHVTLYSIGLVRGDSAVSLPSKCAVHLSYIPDSLRVEGSNFPFLFHNNVCAMRHLSVTFTLQVLALHRAGHTPRWSACGSHPICDSTTPLRGR